MDPQLWNLQRRNGRLWLDDQDLVALASEHDTPLYVVSAATLRRRSGELLNPFKEYPAAVTAHYSYKTNPLAGVATVLHEVGLGAEVASGYELWLARRLGVAPNRIILNGPNKSARDLEAAATEGVGLVVIDGEYELERVERTAAEAGIRLPIALRICPNVVAGRTNPYSVTGSRRSQFGIVQGSEEYDRAVTRSLASPHLRLRGAMAHIGSGIHDLRAFQRMADRLLEALAGIARRGGQPDLIDIGGGLGARHSAEFSRAGMLAYLGFGRLPRARRPPGEDFFERYAAAVTEAVVRGCRTRGLEVPALALEPGRALVSDAQVLLLGIGAVRERPGVGCFAFADGGAMTVSMMFLSESHAVLLANREAPLQGRTSIFGRLPSPLDVVYRNLPSASLKPGDVLAVMDAGAYFVSTETCFGGMRPPVVLIDGGRPHLIRRRETFGDRASTQPPLDALSRKGRG